MTPATSEKQMSTIPCEVHPVWAKLVQSKLKILGGKQKEGFKKKVEYRFREIFGDKHSFEWKNFSFAILCNVCLQFTIKSVMSENEWIKVICAQEGYIHICTPLCIHFLSCSTGHHRVYWAPNVQACVSQSTAHEAMGNHVIFFLWARHSTFWTDFARSKAVLHEI